MLIFLISFVSSLQTQDKLTSLPGFNMTDLNIYSGYLDLNANRSFHYIFVETTNLSQTNAPLIVWMNGGPGCSSIEGFLSEIGPYVFQDQLSQNLTQNQYSWAQFANLLFLESPSDVGYSHNGQNNFTYSDKTTANDNLAALLAFFTYFPKYQSLDLWIIGESYAGICFDSYIPYFAKKILDFNKKQPVEINLKGIMIGNGLLSERKSLEIEELAYSKDHYFIGPNRGFNCKGSKQMEKCQQSLMGELMSLRQLNFYDVYGYCYQVNTTLKFSQETMSLPCVSITNIESYMNENKEYFNVESKKSWKMCRGMVEYKQAKKGSMKKLKKLIGEIKIVLYSGDNDGLVPYSYTLEQIKRLKLGITKTWYPFNVGDQLGGFEQDYEMGVTFFTVRGSGHMCPFYKRRVSYEKVRELVFA